MSTAHRGLKTGTSMYHVCWYWMYVTSTSIEYLIWEAPKRRAKRFEK